MPYIKHIAVFGGTGAQGSSVVRYLSQSGRFEITVPTRNASAAAAQKIGQLPHVKLIYADYETERGMRKIFQGQDGVYFNLNSFSISEPYEYFWTFRAYEIAVQSGLKLFVLSGGPDRFQAHGYKEDLRNSHGTVKARLSSWLSHQPLNTLPWSITYGGVYAEMLWTLLRPRVTNDGVYEFAAPIGDGNIPLTPLDEYGARARWIFENPDAAIGQTIEWPPYYSTYEDIVHAFQEITKKPAVWKNITQDQWFERLREYKAPEAKVPTKGAFDDDATFTFRKTFGAWWNLWRYNDRIRDADREKEVEKLADLIYPARLHSLADWMRAVGYTGVM